jgi:hypothetical protein
MPMDAFGCLLIASRKKKKTMTKYYENSPPEVLDIPAWDRSINNVLLSQDIEMVSLGCRFKLAERRL